jgi:hypothetical protein
MSLATSRGNDGAQVQPDPQEELGRLARDCASLAFRKHQLVSAAVNCSDVCTAIAVWRGKVGKGGSAAAAAGGFLFR